MSGLTENEIARLRVLLAEQEQLCQESDANALAQMHRQVAEISGATGETINDVMKSIGLKPSLLVTLSDDVRRIADELKSVRLANRVSRPRSAH